MMVTTMTMATMSGRATKFQATTLLLLALLCSSAFTVIRAAATISAYPVSYLYNPVYDFELTANGKTIPAISNANYYHAHFEMGDGTATIAITIKEHIKKVRLSPRKLGMSHRIAGSNTITFEMPRDAYVIVKINRIREIVLLADPPMTRTPQETGLGIRNVVEYGADYTGTDWATKPIQSAINDASKAWKELSRNSKYTWDQALVVIPPGIYFVGNLEIKSNVALYLAPGAVLRFSGRREDYTSHYFKASQGLDVTWWIRTAFGSRNIRFFGRGIVDGNGWEATLGRSESIGNNLLVAISTTSFRCEGITFRNSGAWMVAVIGTRDAVFKDIKFLNRLDMGENDGIDIMNSNDVSVVHSIAISLDDPYSTKTWAKGTAIARSWPKGIDGPNSNIVFDDALAWTRCFGFKVGQGVMRDQRDITFRNSVVYDAAVGIGINHKWGRKSVKGVRFEDIQIERTSMMLENRSSWQAVFISNGDKLGGGMVEDVTFKNIKVFSEGRTASQLSGISPSAYVRGVKFDNAEMPGRDAPATSLEELGIEDVRWVKDITGNRKEQRPMQPENKRLDGVRRKEVPQKLKPKKGRPKLRKSSTSQNRMLGRPTYSDIRVFQDTYRAR